MFTITMTFLFFIDYSRPRTLGFKSCIIVSSVNITFPYCCSFQLVWVSANWNSLILWRGKSIGILADFEFKPLSSSLRVTVLRLTLTCHVIMKWFFWSWAVTIRFRKDWILIYCSYLGTVHLFHPWPESLIFSSSVVSLYYTTIRETVDWWICNKVTNLIETKALKCGILSRELQK